MQFMNVKLCDCINIIFVIIIIESLITMITKPIVSLSHSLSLLSIASLARFSTDSLNQRVSLVDPATQKKLDFNLFKYHNFMYAAYLQKRRLKRSQIWPKIRILQLNEKQAYHIGYQQLFQVKKLMDEDLIKKIIKTDSSKINSTFIISVFSEEHFKQLIDQYISKVLISGKAPSQQSYQQMKQLQQKVIKLFNCFYFGQPISPLQRQIQMYYLAAKQEKHIKKTHFPKNQLLNCTWRHQDQRLLQQHRNWPDADINLTDITYRPFYQPLNIQDRLPYAQKFYALLGGDNSSKLQKWSFNSNVRKNYEITDENLIWIKDKLFSRTVQYTKCLEFTQTMKIPPDFTIQLLVLNAHIWMISERLKQFDSMRAQTLRKIINQQMIRYVAHLVGSLNIKKLAIMKRNFEQILKKSRDFLSLHFFSNESSTQNPYFAIDSLVWSVIMKQKTQRYAEEVYIFSEYLIKNWQNMQNYSQKDFFDAVVQFDCYLIDPDYRQKIIAVNPQLPEQEFKKQFKNNSQNKSYYYKYRLGDNNNNFTYEQKQMQYQNAKYSFISQLISKIIDFRNKYLTNLQNYDHFSKMDEQKKMSQAKSKKSPWKGEKQRIKETDKQFLNVNEIRKAKHAEKLNVDQGKDGLKPGKK